MLLEPELQRVLQFLSMSLSLCLSLIHGVPKLLNQGMLRILCLTQEVLQILYLLLLIFLHYSCLCFSVCPCYYCPCPGSGSGFFRRSSGASCSRSSASPGSCNRPRGPLVLDQVPVPISVTDRSLVPEVLYSS